MSVAKEYDLYIVNYKSQGFPFYLGDTVGNPWLHEVVGNYDPYEFNVLMNADTAKKKGLKTGDTVVIESLHGKTTGILKATQLVHTNALAIAGVHGLGTSMASELVSRGTSVSPVTSMEEQDMSIDPVTAGLERSPAVKVYKAQGEIHS
jgi:anaerobic selenocysteine-containing dehydrogenase